MEGDHVADSIYFVAVSRISNRHRGYDCSAIRHLLVDEEKANEAMQKVTTPMELVKIEHTWLAAKAIYFICMVVVYVPFMIPTILLFL